MIATSLRTKSLSHLEEAGLGYLGHLRRAAGIGTALLSAGLACLVHGLVPGLFTTSASRTVLRLHKDIAAPAHQSSSAHWIEFEI